MSSGIISNLFSNDYRDRAEARSEIAAIGILLAIGVLVVVAVCLMVYATRREALNIGRANEAEVVRTMTESGATNIHVRSMAWVGSGLSGCGERDSVAYTIEATMPPGHRVTTLVCCARSGVTSLACQFDRRVLRVDR